MKGNLAKLGATVMLVTLFLMPYTVLALGLQTAPTAIKSLTGVFGVMCNVIKLLFTILIIVAVIFVLVAAFKYLTAAGDPEKVKSASHTLIYAAVAIAVAIIARGVPLIVQTFVGGSFKGC